jgi:hypothetical protein
VRLVERGVTGDDRGLEVIDGRNEDDGSPLAGAGA